MKKNLIENLIVEEKESNFINHFLTIFKYNPAVYSGQSSETQILLWKTTLFLRCNYPIFCLTFDENKLFTKIEIKLNPVHKFFNYLIVSAFIILVIHEFIYTEFKPAIIFSFIMLLKFGLSFLLFHSILRFERKNQVKELQEKMEKLERK